MFQGMSDYWDFRATSYDDLFDRAPIRSEVMNLLGGLVPRTARTVLDLGAGTGRLVELLGTLMPNARFILVDASAEMLTRAKLRLTSMDNVEFHVASFEGLPVASSTVDLVVSSFALHHVDERGKKLAAAEIHRVLRPDGVAIIADEIISDHRLISDPDGLHRRMLEIFYPNENSRVHSALFADLREFPVDPQTLIQVFQSAAFSTEMIRMNDLVSIMIVKKELSHHAL